jgi:hypothetical protein
MGKKSKKGATRAGTKQRPAAGKGGGGGGTNKSNTKTRSKSDASSVASKASRDTASVDNNSSNVMQSDGNKRGGSNSLPPKDVIAMVNSMIAETVSLNKKGAGCGGAQGKAVVESNPPLDDASKKENDKPKVTRTADASVPAAAVAAPLPAAAIDEPATANQNDAEGANNKEPPAAVTDQPAAPVVHAKPESLVAKNAEENEAKPDHPPVVVTKIEQERRDAVSTPVAKEEEVKPSVPAPKPVKAPPEPNATKVEVKPSAPEPEPEKAPPEPAVTKVKPLVPEPEPVKAPPEPGATKVEPKSAPSPATKLSVTEPVQAPPEPTVKKVQPKPEPTPVAKAVEPAKATPAAKAAETKKRAARANIGAAEPPVTPEATTKKEAVDVWSSNLRQVVTTTAAEDKQKPVLDVTPKTKPKAVVPPMDAPSAREAEVPQANDCGGCVIL